MGSTHTLNPIKVEPVGSTTLGMCTAGVAGVTVPKYPDSPRGRQLREVRLSRHMGQREAAVALGVTSVVVSDLERGALMLTEAEWTRAIRWIQEVRR